VSIVNRLLFKALLELSTLGPFPPSRTYRHQGVWEQSSPVSEVRRSDNAQQKPYFTF